MWVQQKLLFGSVFKMSNTNTHLYAGEDHLVEQENSLQEEPLRKWEHIRVSVRAQEEGLAKI